MKKLVLFEKSIESLNTELLSLLKSQFNLRMQASSNRIRQTHLLRKVRRDIARVKTLLTQKASV